MIRTGLSLVLRLRRKFEKKVARKETRAYQERLQEEINQDREDHGKKPFPPDKFKKEESKEIKESTTDPESGYYVKDERTKQFAYSFHAAADRNGFVLGTIVTPGNTHDIVDAGDAYFRCHEFEENGQLDMGRSRNGLT